MVKRWMEITFILILVYLILSRAYAFSAAIRAIAQGYATSVIALQGRPIGG